jgi:HAD superfamily phosphatase (TIGR01681 family)
MDYISSVYGKKKWHDMPYWYHSKHAFAPDATGLVAHDAARVIAAVRSAPKKCLVFDLDNTIWGGVIGDDGVDGIKIGNGADGEAFLDFQRYMLDLKKRGIMLAVASKNDDQIAREPFEKRPEMLMKLDDILVFRANWDDKASNIRRSLRT